MKTCDWAAAERNVKNTQGRRGEENKQARVFSGYLNLKLVLQAPPHPKDSLVLLSFTIYLPVVFCQADSFIYALSYPRHLPAP